MSIATHCQHGSNSLGHFPPRRLHSSNSDLRWQEGHQEVETYEHPAVVPPTQVSWASTGPQPGYWNSTER